MEALMVTKNLRKSYNNTLIIKDINLVVEKQEFIALLGASGSGKSTLLNLLGSLEVPDTGTISLEGMEYGKLKDQQLAKLRNERIGFVFQFHHLLPEFSIEENILLPANIKGTNEKEAKDYARALMEIVGIYHKKDAKPREMSGGEQQRGAVARALINRPILLLADEPTGNLDNANTTIMQELFQKLNEELKQTIIMATHNLDLSKAAHKILEINSGQMHTS